VANPILQEKLDELFLADLIERLEKGEVIGLTDDGALLYGSAKPATLAVINKYLERHGVGTTKTHANLDRLKGHLEKYQDMCNPPAGEYA
jgi:hypothetical protein